MKTFILALCLAILCAISVLAQSQNSNTSVSTNSTTSVTQNDKAITLESGTRLSGQLQNRLDARKAKAGDLVILKLSQDIKGDGEVVVKKGSRLVGHITEVRRQTKGEKMSSLNIVFDHLQNGAMEIPINAAITSITQAMNHTTIDDGMFDSNTSASANSHATSRSQQSGGLLGGATNTVGGVVNATSNTVGGAVNSTTETAGRATGSIGQPLNGLRITQSSNAKADGTSTLSLTGGDLRLEKGTSFNLILNQATTLTKRK